MSPYPSTRRALIEIERKFLPAPNFLSLLNANIPPPGSHPIPNLKHAGQRRFKDTYLDSPQRTLSSRGIWVRKRTNTGEAAVWQAKIRQSGDYLNSQFEEVEGHSEIQKLLERVMPWLPKSGQGAGGEANDFGLGILARFETNRDIWTAGRGFEVVLDRTDFGHVVGEVELQEEVTFDETEGLDRAKIKKDVAAAMDRDLEDFMREYEWAFPVGKAVGKLTAYFDWIEKRDG